MANQNPNRRELVDMLSKAAFASQFPGFSRWVYAADNHTHHEMNDGQGKRSGPYVPQFFTSEEYALLERLVEMIIPQDDAPGAKDAGVAEFIDFMLANERDVGPLFRTGLRGMDKTAGASYGTGFLKATPAQQEALLSPLAYKKQYRAGQEESQKFFVLLKRYTVMGYYTSRAGLKALDYPGLRLYTSSPACPHVDDPEHKHLPPPRI
jgi:hypothetical protein